MKYISLNKLDEVFKLISNKFPLYLPVDDTTGQAQFKKWAEGDKMSDALNTVRSPKDFFFPQVQDLVNFKVEGKKIEVIDIRKESEDFVIFGVRACDVKSFEVLDRVFLSEPVDTYYKTRREHGIIVSMACTKPSETCFCKTYNIDPANPEGDVVCYTCGDKVYFNFVTEKGKILEDIVADFLEEDDGNMVKAQKEFINDIMSKLPLADLSTEGFTGEKMLEIFNSDKWGELSQSCIGCGTCTFVCPTCQCYDIKDFNTGDGVVRFRCWDSCMYSDFTQMSAGQPRLTQLERFRQRFMHKLVYYPMNNDGLYSCVGCGRCLAKCPISMNIVKVMKALGGKK